MAGQLADEPLYWWLVKDTAQTTIHYAERFIIERNYEELLYIAVVRRLAILNELLTCLTRFEMIDKFTLTERPYVLLLVSRLTPFYLNWQHPMPDNQILDHNELRMQAEDLAREIHEVGSRIWARPVQHPEDN